MLAPNARVETDVERFEASSDPALYGGDLLPDDPYAEWAEERRLTLRARYLDALRRRGRWDEVVGEDPADEAAQRAVMRARFAAGDRRAALRAFERLRAALEALGLEPSVETLALNARIAGGAAFDQALAAVDVELAEAPVAERADLLATRADLLLAMGDRSAPAAYADAAGAAGSGAEGTALRIRQAWAQLVGGDASAAQATLAPLDPTTDELRAAKLVAQAAAAWYSGEPAEAGLRAAEAEKLSVATGLGPEARTAVQIQVMVAHSTGQWSSAVRGGFDASLLAPDLGDTVFDGHLCVGEYALTSGDPLENIRAVGEDIYTRSVRSGARRAQIFASTLLGEIALITGNVDEADTRLREAVRLSKEIGAITAEALASLRLGEAVRARGEPSEGDELLSDALVISRWSPMSGHLVPLGYAALLRGSDDPKLSAQRLEDAKAYLRSEDLVCAYCGLAFRVAAAIASARAGEEEEAATFLSQAEATVQLWHGGPWPAALDEARAELALVSSENERARALLHSAREAFISEGRRLDAQRVEMRLSALG
jgi:hypothetical protein